MHTRRPESLEIGVIKYKADEGDFSLKWIFRFDDDIETQRIEDDAMIMTFAMSSLDG